MKKKEKISNLHFMIFEWWRQNGRVLPWREKLKKTQAEFEQKIKIKKSKLREQTFALYFSSSLHRDPYRVVVAEMMLQQTQVDRVLPKYENWMKKWQSINDFSAASLTEVLTFWQGLGYNRRARFLWLLAKEIVEQRAGIWPTTEVELRTLPGIGQYTSRAIQVFALGQQVGVVDTNIKRVLQRIFALDIHKEKDFFQFADEVLPRGQADPWHQALMDFGALICTAKNPKCAVCPLQKMCAANVAAQKKGYQNFAEKLQHAPAVVKKKTIKFEETDRYFRGRIVDELRNGVMSQEKLRKILEENYGLADHLRFEKLLNGLKKEGLINLNYGLVTLG